MASVPQSLSSGQSVGFATSPSHIWLTASAPGLLELSSSGSEDIASITMALPRSAMSSLFRLRSFSENHYSSRWLRLAGMNHHRRIKWRLAGVACKAKKKLRVSIFSDLLDGFLIAQAKPVFDEQRAKRQPDRLGRSASGGIELSGICFFQLFPSHQSGEDPPAVVRVQRAAKWHMEFLD